MYWPAGIRIRSAKLHCIGGVVLSGQGGSTFSSWVSQPHWIRCLISLYMRRLRWLGAVGGLVDRRRSLS